MQISVWQQIEIKYSFYCANFDLRLWPTALEIEVWQPTARHGDVGDSDTFTALLPPHWADVAGNLISIK